MTDYQLLLDKYSDSYVPGERRSSEYEKKLRVESLLKHRMLIVDELSLEAKYLLLSHSQKNTVKFLVKTFNTNFKGLHRRASDETIILAFIFYIKKLEVPKIQLKNYKITKKYNLTDVVFELILCRLTDYFMSNYPVQITMSSNDNHDDLVKTGDYT